MFEGTYRKRLGQDLRHWQEQGWVTAEGATAILASVGADRSNVGLSAVIAVLGAVLLGLGAAGLVAGSIVLGTGHLCSVVGQQAAVANTAGPGRFDTAFGYYTFAASLGQALGPALITVVGGAGTIPDTRPVFVVAVALAGALLVCTAERAKHAHYRYFGRTVGALPFPDTTPEWDRLVRAARRGQDIDEAVARLYGVSAEELELLREFLERRLGAR